MRKRKWKLCINKVTFVLNLLSLFYTKVTGSDEGMSKMIINTTPAFQGDIVEKINILRTIHQVPELKLDDDLSTSAAKWGVKMHRKAEAEKRLKVWYAHPIAEGEAVYVNTSGKTHLVTSDMVVKAWYCEIVNFDFSSYIFHTNTAQFTQLVWKDTKRIGIAKVINSETRDVIIVARFAPPGNSNYKEYFKNLLEPLFECVKSSDEFVKDCPEGQFHHGKGRGLTISSIRTRPQLATKEMDPSNLPTSEESFLETPEPSPEPEKVIKYDAERRKVQPSTTSRPLSPSLVISGRSFKEDPIKTTTSTPNPNTTTELPKTTTADPPTTTSTEPTTTTSTTTTPKPPPPPVRLKELRAFEHP